MMDDDNAAAWLAFYRNVVRVRERCRTRPAPPTEAGNRMRIEYARAARAAALAKVVPAEPPKAPERYGKRYRKAGARWCFRRRAWVKATPTSPV